MSKLPKSKRGTVRSSTYRHKQQMGAGEQGVVSYIYARASMIALAIVWMNQLEWHIYFPLYAHFYFYFILELYIVKHLYKCSAVTQSAIFLHWEPVSFFPFFFVVWFTIFGGWSELWNNNRIESIEHNASEWNSPLSLYTIMPLMRGKCTFAHRTHTFDRTTYMICPIVWSLTELYARRSIRPWY